MRRRFLSSLRPILVDNLSWKLLSFGLAVLIWSGARLFIGDEMRPLVRPLQPVATRDFMDVPIRVLTPPGDSTIWEVRPATVHVRAGAEIGLVERLTQSDPVVYVQPAPDLLDRPSTNRVEVRLPPAVRLLSVLPERVVVSAAPRPLPTPRPAPEPPTPTNAAPELPRS